MVNAGISSEGWDIMKKGFLWNRKKRNMHFGQANVGEGQKIQERVPVVGTGLGCICDV